MGTSNPSTIYGKEDVVADWGEGAWSLCETGATIAVQKSTRFKLEQRGFNTNFGAPCTDKKSNVTDGLRGEARGTMVASSSKIRPSREPWDPHLWDSQRAAHTFVTVEKHLDIQIMTAYCQHKNIPGFLEFNNTLIANLVKRALHVKCPTVMALDVNCEQDKLEIWQQLKARGWKDAAELHGLMTGTLPANTSRGATRRDVLWLCPLAQRAFISVQVFPVQEFDTHDLVVAKFSWEKNV